MWNLTTLDTSATTNRRSYFHSGVTLEASSTARETELSPPSNFYPHASARHRHAHAPHPVPHHTPHYMPHHTPARAKVACNSRTGVTQQHELIRTGRTLEGNCMRNCWAAPAWARPKAAAGPGHSHQNHRRRRCGERRQGQSKHTRTKPRSIGGRRGACGAWPRCRRAAAGPGPDWRPPRGLRGLAGLRDDAPSEARSADGERAGRPRGGRRSGGPPPTGTQSSHIETMPPQQAAPTAAAAQ